MKFANITSCVALLVFFGVANASLFQPGNGDVLVADNTFYGEITSLYKPDYYFDGDVTVGSKLTGSYILFDDASDIGAVGFDVVYTFHGDSRDYTFGFDGGTLSSWGYTEYDSDAKTLNFTYSNPFVSDGLAATFNPYPLDDYTGYVELDLENYDSNSVSGTGSFEWEQWGFEIAVGPDFAVPEPEFLGLLSSAFIILAGFRMKRENRA